MSVTVIRPPAFEPISLEQARQHLRVDVYPGSPGGHPDDDLITRCIVAARERAEEITRRSLVEQGLRLVAPGFQPGWRWRHGCGGIDLLRPPLISVDRVAYYDDANALQLVDPSDYFVEATPPVHRLRWSGIFTHPCTYARADAVQVDYTAGYAGQASPVIDQDGAASGIPASIINGMLLLIGDMYEHREPTVIGSITANTGAADALFESKRVHNF